MDEAIRLGHFLQCRAERGHQRGGQLLDEADGVRPDGPASFGEAHAAGGGVQGGEEFVVRIDAALVGRGPDEGVEQGRFADVRVADERHVRHGHGLAPLALDAALAPHPLDASLEVLDAPADVAALVLELALAGAAGADAADLLRETAPSAGEPRQHVGELGQLDLELALASAGAPGEDVEDEPGAVEHLGAGRRLEGLLLGGGQVLVEDDGARAVAARRVGDFLDFAFADQERGIEPLQPLGHDVRDDAASGLGEPPQLLDALLHRAAGALELQPDEDNALHQAAPSRASASSAQTRASPAPDGSQRTGAWRRNQVAWRLA